jgi:hypothetical protein
MEEYSGDLHLAVLEEQFHLDGSVEMAKNERIDRGSRE